MIGNIRGYWEERVGKGMLIVRWGTYLQFLAAEAAGIATPDSFTKLPE